MTDSAITKIDRTISSSDGMIDNDGGDHYFRVGLSALKNIERALSSIGQTPNTPARILDCPCGHGRVLRYLRAAFPLAEIIACDLLRDGVDFCTAQFGALPVYFDPVPARIPVARSAFDLIWVGSLLTHLGGRLRLCRLSRPSRVRGFTGVARLGLSPDHQCATAPPGERQGVVGGRTSRRLRRCSRRRLNCSRLVGRRLTARAASERLCKHAFVGYHRMEPLASAIRVNNRMTLRELTRVSTGNPPKTGFRCRKWRISARSQPAHGPE
jgi:SAM-dependent methyltransferase